MVIGTETMVICNFLKFASNFENESERSFLKNTFLLWTA